MINPIIESIFWSLLPISELRGGIPVAVYRGINIHYAFIICVIGVIVFRIKTCICNLNTRCENPYVGKY